MSFFVKCFCGALTSKASNCGFLWRNIAPIKSRDILMVRAKFFVLTLSMLDIPANMSTLANSEDPDEMLHHAAFHLGLHCLL